MSSRSVVGVCLMLALVVVVFAVGASPQVVPGGSVKPIDPAVVRRVPTIHYTMASPRAALIGPPLWSNNTPRAYYLPSGGAENFPRGSGSIRVRTGSRIVFSLSRELEGVWYAGSYGALSTSLELQWCRACKCTDAQWKECVCVLCECAKCKCAACACPDVDCDDASRVDCDCPATSDVKPVICPWVTIGKDGAKDVRKGPSIGRAKVGVPVCFRRPGIYYLRGIVRTVAQPFYPRPIEPWYDRLVDENATDKVLPRIPAAVDKDIVYVRVQVADWPVADVEPDVDPADDPDVANIKPMPKDAEESVIVEQLSADLNGDETVNLGDLAILSQQWGKEYEMPLADDE